MISLARWVKVLTACLSALRAERIVTQRDIFYLDVQLFGKRQETVNKMLTELAAVMGVPRNALGVVASPRGLFAGRLRIELACAVERAGEGPNEPELNQDCRRLIGMDGAPNLIHDGSMIRAVDYLSPSLNDTAEPRWILIVEKEAVFRTLCEDRITAGVDGFIEDGILITVIFSALTSLSRS